jgi:hypothetical protein
MNRGVSIIASVENAATERPECADRRHRAVKGERCFNPKPSCATH